MAVRAQVKLVPATVEQFKAALQAFASEMGIGMRDLALGQGALLARDSAVFTPPFPRGGGRGLGKSAEKAGNRAVEREVRKVVVAADDKKGGAQAITAMRLVGAVHYGDFATFRKLKDSPGLKSVKGNNSIFQKILNDANAERAYKKARNFFNKAQSRANAFGRVEASASDAKSVHQVIKAKYSGRIWKNKGPGFPWSLKHVVDSKAALDTFIEKTQEDVGSLKSGWWSVASRLPRPIRKDGKEEVLGMSGWLPWVKRHGGNGSFTFTATGGNVRLIIANLIGDSDGVASGVDDPPGGVPAIALGLRVANLQRALAARLEKAARKFSS